MSDPGISPVIDGLLRFSGILYIAIALAVTRRFAISRIADRDAPPEAPRYLVDGPSLYWVCSVTLALVVTALSLSPA